MLCHHWYYIMTAPLLRVNANEDIYKQCVVYESSVHGCMVVCFMQDATIGEEYGRTYVFNLYGMVSGLVGMGIII